MGDIYDSNGRYIGYINQGGPGLRAFLIVAIPVVICIYAVKHFTGKKTSHATVHRIFYMETTTNTAVRSEPTPKARQFGTLGPKEEVLVLDTAASAVFVFEGKKARYFMIASDKIDSKSKPQYVWGGNLELKEEED